MQTANFRDLIEAAHHHRHEDEEGDDDGAPRGLPIGSGFVEEACKTVIGRRFKHGEARWHVAHANAVAALCSLLYSDP